MNKMNRSTIVEDEVMSIMRDRSIENGYKSIRVGMKVLASEVAGLGQISTDEVDKAINDLIERGYLIKNGAHTVDVGQKDYFHDHQRNPEAIKELVDVAEEILGVTPKETEPDDNLAGTDSLNDSQLSELDRALDALELRLGPVTDKDTKLAVLERLSMFLHPSIAVVLDDIAEIIESMEAAS